MFLFPGKPAWTRILLKNVLGVLYQLAAVDMRDKYNTNISVSVYKLVVVFINHFSV